LTEIVRLRFKAVKRADFALLPLLLSTAVDLMRCILPALTSASVSMMMHRLSGYNRLHSSASLHSVLQWSALLCCSSSSACNGLGQYLPPHLPDEKSRQHTSEGCDENNQPEHRSWRQYFDEQVVDVL
jgi:hypothetical protein